MEHKQLLGSSFECECTKTHTVPTKHLIYKNDAFDSLPEFIEPIIEWKTCLILADKRTWKAAGNKILLILEKGDVNVEYFILPDLNGNPPVADDKTRDLILKSTVNADLYISVGSGVINDLTKWVAFLRNRPFISVPTAASMNGYASANVAAKIDGLKVLFHANACQAVFVNPEIIINAPYDLTTAGLGDVLAKPVSSADWRLNNFLFNEYYCQFSVDLLKDLEPIYLENSNDLKNKSPGAFKALFKALFFSSIAMTITGTSSPASGGEHLISHTLDMIASRDKKTHDLHGRQVGVASILMAALYEKIMRIETPVFTTPPQSINKKFWGSLSNIVTDEYDKKLEKFARAEAILSKKENWIKLKASLRDCLIGPEKLKNCLKQADGIHCFKDLKRDRQPIKRDDFIEAFKNANQMRRRFTVLDLAYALGILPDEAGTLVNNWVS